MSYDLYFWQQSKIVEISPSEIVDRLDGEQSVDGIERIPREHVRRVLKEWFPEIQDGDIDLTWEGEGSYFQISFAHVDERNVQMIVANCGWELLKSETVVNRLIEACRSLGCGVYNPQTDEWQG